MRDLTINKIPDLLKKEKYDCIFSLGGSCAAAFQLKFRNLRKEAFPFDWLYYTHGSTIKKLALCFKEDFVNWLKPENMKELTEKEIVSNNNLQYEDLYTGYRFIHDFKISFEKEFPKIKEKYRRRIKRLYDKIENSNNILLILNTSVSIDLQNLTDLKSTLNTKWSNKNFDIVVVKYSSSKENITQEDENIYIIHTRRSEGGYDYDYVTFEYAFLDKYKLKQSVHTKTLVVEWIHSFTWENIKNHIRKIK